MYIGESCAFLFFLVDKVVDVDALAVDTNTGKLYFSQDGAVNSVNGFGSDRKRIFIPDGDHPEINGIAVDPGRR